MGALPNSFMSFIGAILSVLMSFVSLFQAPGYTKTDEMPTTPEDFTPAVRFVVCSDTHNRNDNVAAMINRCYELYDNDPVYSGIDVFVFCGDMTSVGGNGDMDHFKAALDENIKGDTLSLVLLGNHEMKNSKADDYFTELFGVEPNQHITVNGFHFISVSNSYERAFSFSDVSWASKETDKAIEDTPELPVFTFQHPHNFGTVYGSTVWSTPLIDTAWNGKSNVVNFSGHSHYPINDPRSIWQGSYTALGCGGMNYFELDKDFVVGQHPEGYKTAAQFYIVEADTDGSVRIVAYDLNSESFFGEEYFIENINDKSTYAYTYMNRKEYDEPPVWNENTQVSIEKNENGEYILTFDEAQDKFIVHNYKIKVYEGGILKQSKTHISDYYLINNSETASFNLGELNLKSGKECTVEITAVNAYFKLSEPLVYTFTAN